MSAQVSILIPIYNAEKFVAKTIQSVQNQTFEDWEIIALDDCSTDNSYDVIQAIAKFDKRVKPYRNEQNFGMMANWNEGLKLCKAPYFAKLDADDLWHPSMLAEAWQVLMQFSEVGMVATNYINIDPFDNLIIGTESVPPEFAKNKFFNCIPIVQAGPRRMFQYNILRQGISLIRRRIFDTIGPFTLLNGGDTEMWFRIGCHYNIYQIDKTYYYYRVSPESFVSRTYQQPGVAERGFYEVRNKIISYYYQQNKISNQDYKKFIRDTEFIYNSYLIYKARTNKRYIEMCRTLIRNTVIDPKRMLIENLHIDRVLK